jgi:hypothetical protein
VSSSASSAMTNVVAFGNSLGYAPGTMTVMLSGNAQGSIADFQIPYSVGTIVAYAASTYADAQNGSNGSTPSASSSLSALQAATSTTYYYNSSASPYPLLHVRIVLGSSTLGSSLSQNWGGTFTGQPVYVRFSESPW